MFKTVTKEEFETFMAQFPDSSRLMEFCPYVQPSYRYFKNKNDYMGSESWGKIIARERYNETDKSYSYTIWENEKWNLIKESARFVKRVKTAWKLAGTMTKTNDSRI